MENAEPNNQDNGLELLNKVIETNEANIEQSVKLLFAHEDILNLIGESEHTLRCIYDNINKAEKFSEKESKKRNEFLEKIPSSINAHLSQHSISFLNNFETKILRIRYLLLACIMVLCLGVAIMVTTGYFALQWYSKSIVSKSEIRQEILTEFKEEGLSLLNSDQIKTLEKQNKLIKVWMDKYPEDAESFRKFKSGYDAAK